MKNYLFILTAYFIWGFFPIVFYYIKGVDPLVITWFRAFSLLVLLTTFLIFTQRGSVIKKAFLDKTAIKKTLISSILLFLNWLVFVVAILDNQTIQTSLAYLTSPILTLLMSRIILKERLLLSQNIIVFLLFIMLGIFSIVNHAIPTYSIIIFTAWALYGFLQKKSSMDALTKLFLEMIFINIIFLALIPFLINHDYPFVLKGYDILQYISFIIVGTLSLIALLTYNTAVSKIPFKMVAILQYITPLGQILSGVLFYNEYISTSNFIIYMSILFLVLSFTVIQIRKKNKK